MKNSKKEIILILLFLFSLNLASHFLPFERASISNDDYAFLVKAKNMSFLLKNTRGRYKIVFQNRNGDIGYFDQKTKKEFVEHPLTVAQSELLISRFDPSQACYIGLLAGISLEKALTIDQKTGQNTAQELFKKMPKLRVID